MKTILMPNNILGIATVGFLVLAIAIASQLYNVL